ncbi:MAG TPA: hypothetical protein VEK08_03405 [Planctomycetota bacterium]|nr:hypothetical protein [Planctomycetota bacterium]
MSEHEWKISKPAASCCACQAAFVAEQRTFSALLQNADGLQRQDYCESCFQARRPENVFYFWRTVQPNPDSDDSKPQRPRVDVDYVLDFFKRLEGDSNTQRIAFRYILALMLARKKMLVFESKKKDAAGQDLHLFREKRGGQLHSVLEPSLSEEEISTVSAELGVLLGLTPPPQKATAQQETGAGAQQEPAQAAQGDQTSGPAEAQALEPAAAAPVLQAQAQGESELTRRSTE